MRTVARRTSRASSTAKTCCTRAQSGIDCSTGPTAICGAQLSECAKTAPLYKLSSARVRRYPRKTRYMWGADGNCEAANLSDMILGRWEVPSKWQPLLAYEGTGIVQNAECNHWRAVGLPFNGPTVVANLSTVNLTMSLDLWYAVSNGAPSLYIRMIDTPSAQIVLTDAVQGFAPAVGSQASSVCVPPGSCKGAPTPGQYGSYCVARPNCNLGQLGGAVGWACGQLIPTGFDCGTDIPANCSVKLEDKANYVFSVYFEQFESTGATCDFGGVGMMSDPFKPLPHCIHE
eukprot:COSAG02_NODE_2241_length_9405_cov_7.458951_4_plen_288_part_00